MKTLYCPCCGRRLEPVTIAARFEATCFSCHAVLSGYATSPESGGYFKLTVSPRLTAQEKTHAAA